MFQTKFDWISLESINVVGEQQSEQKPTESQALSLKMLPLLSADFGSGFRVL